MKTIKYLIVALTHFKVVGNFIPSQKSLVRNLTNLIDKNARCIVEFGAGEGCVTRGINSKVGDDCVVLSFEINPKMIKLAEKNGTKGQRKNTHMINDDVLNFSKYLKNLGIEKIDYVVSSLPLAQIKKDRTHTLLSEAVKFLKDDGAFMQYQYSTKNLKDLKKYFKNITIKFTPMNFPPAFVYTCKK